MLRWAEAYASRLGWAVLPLHSVRGEHCSCGRTDCHSPGKHPRVAHGVDDASSDPSQIRHWWRQNPDANIGLAAGESFWVLDVDGEPGEQSLSKLILEHGWVPAGPVARTGSGGQHWFLAPDSRVGNRVKVAPGLDVRAAGGYVVAAPSNHASGGRYAWISPPRVDVPLPAAPDWLIALVSTPPRRDTSRPPPPPLTGSTLTMAERARCYIASIEGGQRHCGQAVSSRCLRVAQVLVRRFQLPREVAYAMLDEWSRERCTPPYSERELSHKLRQAETVGRMQIGGI